MSSATVSAIDLASGKLPLGSNITSLINNINNDLDAQQALDIALSALQVTDGLAVSRTKCNASVNV